jgi:glycosyltransferase involved in cell wall biosynthesis
MGWLEGLYQWLALVLLRWFPVITTSPVLLDALQQAGLPVDQLCSLPCALPQPAEQAYTALWSERQHALSSSQISWPSEQPRGVLIAIGRLDSYKRFDWLIEALAAVPAVAELHLLGDGPDRPRLEAMAHELLSDNQVVQFHGRVSEAHKLQLLAAADLLVLPSDRCNEAFGIVQLEAMACGIPAIAFQLPRSGMHWVGALSAMPWSGEPRQLPDLLQRLLTDPPLFRLVCRQARERYERQFSRQIWRRQLVGLGFLEA